MDFELDEDGWLNIKIEENTSSYLDPYEVVSLVRFLTNNPTAETPESTD